MWAAFDRCDTSLGHIWKIFGMFGKLIIPYDFSAISWSKKSFRKYCKKIANFELFHQHVARLLTAPTIELTRLLQDDIVQWLHSAREHCAAEWFEEYWCGEKGNYTNATAGYVANSLASGIESHWRYTRRDTVGTSGTNQRISLKTFAGALVRNMRTNSERHAVKLKEWTKGCFPYAALRFPTEPIISVELWKLVDKFQAERLSLSFVEGKIKARKQWSEAVALLRSCKPQNSNSFFEMVTTFRAAGHSMPMCRTFVRGLQMPSSTFYRYLTENQGLTGKNY